MGVGAPRRHRRRRLFVFHLASANSEAAPTGRLLQCLQSTQDATSLSM